MSSLIVVRIVPQSPVGADTFTGYLQNLRITAYDLTFNNPTVGDPIGSSPYFVAYVAPTALPATASVSPPVTPAEAQYPSGTTQGIVQQYDLESPPALNWSEYYQLQSVATAIIEVASPNAIENLRLVAQWVSSAGTQTIQIPTDYYDVALVSGSAPDPNSWASLQPTVYLQLPAPPASADQVVFTLPSDGTPPPFDSLYAAVKKILSTDPGGKLTLDQCRNIAYEIVWSQQPPLPTPPTAPTPPTPLTPPESIGPLYTNPPNVGSLLSGSTPNSFESDRQQFEAQLRSYYALADATADRLTPYVYALSAAVACEQRSLAAWQAIIEFPVITGQQNGAPPPTTQVILTGLVGVDPPAGFGVPAAYFYALGASMPPQITPAQRYQLATTDNPDHLLAGFTSAINAGTVTDSETYATPALATLSINAAQSVRRMVALGVPANSSVALAPLGTVAYATTVAAPAGSPLPMSATDGISANMAVGADAIPGGTTVQSVSALPALTVTVTPPTTSTVPAGTRVVFTPAFDADLQQLVAQWLAYPPAIANTPSTETYESSDDAAKFWPDAANNHASAYLDLVLCALTQTYFIPLPFDVPLGLEIGGLATSVSGLASIPVTQWTTFFRSNPTFLPPFTQPGNTDARIAAFVRNAQQFFAAQSGGPASSVNLATSQDTPYTPTNPPKPTVLPFASTAGVAVGMSVGGASIPAGTTVAQPLTQTSVTLSTVVPTDVPQGANITFTSVGLSSSLNLATNQDAPYNSNSHPTSTVLSFASTAGVAVGMSVSGPQIPSGTTVTLPPTPTSVTVSPAVPADVPFGTNITFTPNYVPANMQPGVLPLLPAPSTDWIANCLAIYQPPYTFGSGGFDPAGLRSAAAQVFPSDQSAQDWLVDALVTIDNLYEILKSIPLPPVNPQDFMFSLAEALFARGFGSAADVTQLTAADFQRALTGTVAYDLATPIYNSALAISPPAAPPPPPSAGFQPINDGTLTNCIPRPCRSPLGPVAYLSEMLRVTESSTCEVPFASTVSLTTSGDTPAGQVLPFTATTGVVVGMAADGTNIALGARVTALTPTSITLNKPVTADVPIGTVITFNPALVSMIAQRRGPIGELAASCVNLEVPLPLIDIVNECLEFLGAAATPTSGAVYDTSAESVAGHALCREDCPPEHDGRHEPAALPAALPEHATPATPTAANAAVEPAVYDKLKADFSSCRLPYSQAIDVSRSYLRHFGSSRFDTMRTFRKCITEFALDPVNEPAGFQSYLWRYPVRIDTAIEYLAIAPEEYELLFKGPQPKPCAAPVDTRAASAAPDLTAWQLYGFPSPTVGTEPWTTVAVQLPEFLARTCLTYCEFIELRKCQYVLFQNVGDPASGDFPDCEPCCPQTLWIEFPQSPGPDQALYQLAVFIRLWRKLKEAPCGVHSFHQLRDICDVLHLFNGTAINPDFIRQLAALALLRDHFRLDLVDRTRKPGAGAVDADRTQLLALWVGPTAAAWPWAVGELIDKIGRYARRHHACEPRGPEFVKLLAANLDPLSRLAGFDPASATDTWHALPTHTLRFAEVLAKIYASDFSIGEILCLFTADHHLDGDDPFPLQEANDALDTPLELPDERQRHSLRELRAKLLAVDTDEEDARRWSWKHIEAALRDELGYPPDDIRSLGAHLFAKVVRHGGQDVDVKATRYFSSLPLADTSAAMWNTPPDGPFQYDAASQQLWTHLPLDDDAVIAKLNHVHTLDAAEQKAVQDLYFQPRAELATFAALFSDFAKAQRHLIEERDEDARWHYFRRQFALCHRRCKIIAEHLAEHVEAATGRQCPDAAQAALLILRELYADENAATAAWENDQGTTPPVTWQPPANGGAFAALLGLVGTGLITEYAADGGAVWRDAGAELSPFGRARDAHNCPVPTVLPAMSFTLPPQQMQFVNVHNGFASKDADGERLGGAQGFAVTLTGALLVDREGDYEFWAGAPTPEGEPPDWNVAEHRRWRVALKRGQRTSILLRHDWPGEPDHRSSALSLRRGAYELIVEFAQPSPAFTDEAHIHPQHAGFQIKYRGPDSDGVRIEIPHHRLFQVSKHQPLGEGITPAGAAAATYLGRCYVSSLRDIRRTYQRAFKALLFAHRFELAARRRSDGHSELGYMLHQTTNFAGAAYYRAGGAFARHLAGFDFNFLPVRDNYFPPSDDARAHPSSQRIQAMFDWWERSFDYVRVREAVRRHGNGRHLWHLFDEAAEKQPAEPAYLLRHMGADSRHWHIDLRYFQDQNSPVYAVTSADLEDDRWVVRAWHADRWIEALVRAFDARDIAQARPDLWASDDPSAPVPGESVTGNAKLSAFLCDGCFENGMPRRYADVARLNDGLRQRGRDALLAYLCHMNRVALPFWPGHFATTPRNLSDLLLLDVEAGICERASRIEEAITAIQAFVQRARLHLEPGWTVTRDFARMWDREFASFHTWQACKRRHLYKENVVEWDELENARRIESFRFFEERLRSATLTVAAPGGLEWWPDERPPHHDSIELLQQREPSAIGILPKPREGLNLLGTPERDARPSWLAAVQPSSGGINIQTANQSATPSTAQSLPFWMESAIRLGTKFYRIAAAGAPPAATGFRPQQAHHGEHGCVTCCVECGKVHPATVDEYYFWLVDGRQYQPPANRPANVSTASPNDYQYGYQDDYYDAVQQQSAFWQDTTQLPQLLAWQSSPIVRLAWCRVHNGEFQQPRRSAIGVPVTDTASADLAFQGRMADSLVFTVTNPADPSPQPGHLDTSPPGFRYDLATDHAVALPLVSQPPTSGSFPGGLPAYPYFCYHASGTHLLPLSPFGPALAAAATLRSRCRFEAALAWYRLAFDPVTGDCTWVHCETHRSPSPSPSPPPPPSSPASTTSTPVTSTGASAASAAPTSGGAIRNAPPAPAIIVSGGNGVGACCDSTDVSCAVAKDRAVVLHYLETLRDYGDAVLRRHSPEAFQQARVIFDAARRILGEAPPSILLPEPAGAQTVATFKPAFAPLNPRLLDLYDVVRDRLDLIRRCLDSSRLRDARLDRAAPYFGADPLREGWRTAFETCAEEAEWCHLHSPYRFAFLVQKAHELVGKVREFGAGLLAAFEKGDAEYLAALRAQHARELLTLGLAVRKDQWRDADWQVEALQKTKTIAHANLQYYNDLILTGLDFEETAYQDLTITSTVLRTVSNAIEGVGGASFLTGNFFAGTAGFGGSPLIYAQLPIGEPLGNSSSSAARVLNALAEIASSLAGLELTEAGWDRREQEWVHQTQILAIEIEQAEQQILGAQRRRDQALQELNSHRRQMEQSAEEQDFLRDKFTAHDLYLFLQRETTSLYYRMYDLALRTALQAERAFNFERGHTTRRFVPRETWGDLHEGLMAGERLDVAMRHMEKAYLDENVREYELTKQISLRLHFPAEYLRLRATGHCEIAIPEWMFDLDHPGHYMRRLRDMTVTFPCVAGPYTTVNGTLTQLGSMTRIDPTLRPAPRRCCCEGGHRSPYELCHDDPRAVREFAAREAIATSSGQNDSGLFELNFHDERYLPFEFHGAVGRWRIDLPPENNYFDFDTLSDVVLRINYTAREGGEMLRRAANEAAQRHLPGDGWCLFDVRHDLPDAWRLFRERRHERVLDLRLTPDLFPFIPGRPALSATGLALVFETEAPCPEDRYDVELVRRHDDRRVDRLAHGHRHGDGHGDGHEPRDADGAVMLRCVESAEWPRLYLGVVNGELGPIDRNGRGGVTRLRFPPQAGEIARLFALVHYQAIEPGPLRRDHRPRRDDARWLDGLRDRPQDRQPARGDGAAHANHYDPPSR